MKADKTKFFMGILALFASVIVAQSYFLYDLNESIKKTKSQQEHNTKVGANNFFNAHSIDPFIQMQQMQEQMQKSFGQLNSLFADDPFFKEAFSQMDIRPLSDIKEDDNKYIIELNIPGAQKQNIEITNRENTLSVYAKSEFSKEDNSSNYIHKERYYQSFSRSFILPQNADLDNLTHQYDSGVLKINIPKK